MANLHRTPAEGNSPSAGTDFDTLFQTAQNALQYGRLEAALGYFERLALHHPQRPDPHLGRALVLERLENWVAAEAAIQQAIRMAPHFPHGHLQLASLLTRRGDWEGAEVAVRRALALDRGQPDAWRSLAEIRLARDAPEDALKCLREAIRLNPEAPDLRLQLAETLRQAGFPEGALALLEGSRQPRDARWWVNRALAEEDSAQWEEAWHSIQRACEADPEYPLARWNLSLFALRRGRLGLGWDHYHWGVAAGVRPPLPAQPWQGPRDHRPLWVMPEQGIGDEVLFAGCLTDLASEAEVIHWQGDPRLLPLLARAHPGITFSAQPPPPGYAVLSMGDLPGRYRRHPDRFPHHCGYLRAEPHTVASMRRWLAGLGPGLKLGITWRAGTRFLARTRRGIPFPLWEALFRLPGIQFVSLQHGDIQGERRLAEVSWGKRLHAPPNLDPFHDLDGLAALISALDGVVTVDNATAHLTGALARPGLLLLPRVADWRWFMAREDSPWYPNLRLLRQKRAGDWENVMERAAGILTQAARMGCLDPFTGAG